MTGEVSYGRTEGLRQMITRRNLMLLGVVSATSDCLHDACLGQKRATEEEDRLLGVDHPMTTITTLDDIELRCELSVDPSRLSLSYTLVNRDLMSLGVLHRLWGHAVDGSCDFHPRHVYVDLEGDTLHLVKGVLPAPASPDLYDLQEVPLGTRLSSGGSLHEELAVPLPAKVRQPYKRARFDGRVTASRPARVNTVTFAIGVVRVDNAHPLSTERGYPDHHHVYCGGREAELQVFLRATFPLAAPIEVLDYEGYS